MRTLGPARGLGLRSFAVCHRTDGGSSLLLPRHEKSRVPQNSPPYGGKPGFCRGCGRPLRPRVDRDAQDRASGRGSVVIRAPLHRSWPRRPRVEGDPNARRKRPAPGVESRSGSRSAGREQVVDARIGSHAIAQIIGTGEVDQSVAVVSPIPMAQPSRSLPCRPTRGASKSCFATCSKSIGTKLPSARCT